ncbi:MAG: alpha/beta fold hydrolase [Chloroflexota bacterium]
MAHHRLNAIEQGKGTPLVLLHGFPFDGSIWRDQVERLGQDAHLIAPDMPGFGQSADLEDESKNANMDAYADTLADWLNAKGLDKVVLAGHSMGGYVAFAFARRHPEMLQGLILVSTKAGSDTEAGREGRYKQAAAVEERGAQAVVDAMLPKLFAPATYNDKPELVEQIRAVMLNQDRQGIIAALYAMAGRPDSTPGLSEITVPTLVITGAEDAIIPAPEAEILVSNIKGSKHVPIEAAGHMTMLEQPEAFGDAVSAFLRKL